VSTADETYAEIQRLQHDFIRQAAKLRELRQYHRLSPNGGTAVEAAEARLNQIQTRWRAAIERLRACLDNDNHL
jgi:hypothetical protein